MPATSSSTSAAISTSPTGTSAPPALKRFEFLSKKLSQLAAGNSTNKGSTCAAVQGQIEQYVNKLRFTPQEEDALSFCRNVSHRIHWWRHWQRTCYLPQHLRLMSSGSSLSVAGWQQDEETAWQGIWSCECCWKWTTDCCNCDSILNILPSGI